MNNMNTFMNNTTLKEVIANSKKQNEKLNAFSYFIEDFSCENNEGFLANIPFAIKDNFDLKEYNTSSSSNTLKSHISVTTATVVQRLINHGAIPIGKTNLDEFGMGGTGLASANGPVINPLEPTRIIGGSSSGSTAAVTAGLVPFALGTDTGDSIRQPAAWNGVIGFKPTWGLISRYGIHSFSPSFDTVGFFTTNVKDQATLVSAVSGKDEKDFSCLENDQVDLIKNLSNDIKGKKLAYFKEQEQVFASKYIEKFKILIKELESKGAIIEEISFSPELLNALYPTYQAITFSEATSQLSSIDGINFSDVLKRKNTKTLYENIAEGRRENFGTLLKERIIIGSNSLNKENQNKIFLQAKKIRTLIIQEADKHFEKYDAFINIASEIAPKVIDTSLSTKYKKLTENFFLIANMGGFPSIVVPFDKVENLPISVEISSKIFNDQEVLDIAYAIESMRD